jgi:hypothetical protein
VGPTLPPETATQFAASEDAHSSEPKMREKMPLWLAVLIASILAIVVIWIMLIAIYPSIAL